VKDGERAPLVTCFSGCDPHDAMPCGAADFWIILAALGQTAPARENREGTQEAPHAPNPEALAIWRAASISADTVVEHYLRLRSITLPIAPSIRCCSKLHLGKYELPTMVEPMFLGNDHDRHS